MSKKSSSLTNLEALERFWRRSPFHDQSIIELIALNNRAVIRLAEWTLILTRVTELKPCELPAVWLGESLLPQGERLSLDVETDTGRLLF